ncbi:MAG TPA: ASCH domain-containing protein [Verrucomicrobiae bacterium]|nr:ASCH domain-containing protein [Verrucomicrobiae bacterium]
MTTHHLRLATEPFTAILRGDKTIESRLYDEKRQIIQLGDTIIFTHRAHPEQTIAVRVVGLLRYQTFYDLFRHNPPGKFGGMSPAQLEKQIDEFYSLEEQHRYGVVGIEFELLAQY